MICKGIIKKMISIMVVLAFVLGIFYSMPSTAKAEDYYEYLYVGDTLVMYQEYDDGPVEYPAGKSGPGWTFDDTAGFTDRILILDGYNNDSSEEYGIRGFYHGVKLTIELKGNNSITGKQISGIEFSGGGLFFRGSGTLEVESAGDGISADYIKINECTLLSHGGGYGMRSLTRSGTTIGDDIISVIASGETAAIQNTVKNEIAGWGWNTVDGSDEGEEIPVNTEGRGLEYKKAQFPYTKPVTQYTITYDLNGGTLDGKTGTVSQKYDAGTVIILPTPTKDGCTFDYWEGSKYNAGDQYTVEGDHIFTAVWKTDEEPSETEVPKTDEEPSETEVPKTDEEPSETEVPKTDEEPSETEVPETSDHSNAFAWFALMAIALMGGSAVLFTGKRRKEQ